MEPFVLSILAIVALVAAGSLLYVLGRLIERWRQCWPPEPRDNGIRIGAPKVYDNRSLSLMLEELQNQLRALQSIDAGALKSSLGTQQAQTASSFDVSATVTATAPLQTSGASAKTEGPARPEVTQAKPDAATPSEGGIRFGERAGDLLDDQVNLSYQIFNLRLLLERAISDRLSEDGRPKIQAVIALPISIDPPPYAAGCAATVEVRLVVESPQAAAGAQVDVQAAQVANRPSLVALFPQEETYNTWSVNRHGRQSGAGATSGAVGASVGVASGQSASSIRRYADVVAVEREAGLGELRVAWQFRPSPGERSVKAGLRQVLAVLALPRADEGAGYVKVSVDMRSLWQRWNPRRGTTSAGAGWGAVFSDRPAWYDFGSHGTVSVPAADVLDTKLAPQIRSIRWFRVGPRRACVTVNGKNFFTGTTAVLGDTVVGADNGLTIKSERALQLVVTVEALLHDALLNGRYGQSIEMAKPPDVPPLRIRGVWIDPKPGNQSYETVVDFEPCDGKRLRWDALRALPDPIFAINGSVMPSGLQYDDPGDRLDDNRTVPYVTARALVAPEYLSATSLLLEVRWPFFGNHWSLRTQTYNAREELTAARLSSGGVVALLISGREFRDDVSIVADRPYALDDAGALTRLAPDILRLQLPQRIADACREVLVCEVNRASVSVKVPDAKAASPAIDGSRKPPMLKTGETATADFSGSGLNAVTRVLLNQQEQQFTAFDGGASISVVVDGATVGESGQYEVVFETPGFDPLRAPIVVLSSP